MIIADGSDHAYFGFANFEHLKDSRDLSAKLDAVSTGKTLSGVRLPIGCNQSCSYIARSGLVI